MHTIYTLIDPRDARVRYVGLTYHVLERLKQHRTGDGRNHEKEAWMQEVRHAGQDVLLAVIDKSATEEGAKQKEAYWIDYYQQFRCLTNIIIPPLTLSRPSQETPGMIEMEISQEDAPIYFQKMNALPWHTYLTVNSVAYSPEIQQASLSIAVTSAHHWSYLVTGWLQCEWISMQMPPCYRYHLCGADWATFGDEQWLSRRLESHALFPPTWLDWDGNRQDQEKGT